MGLLGAGRQGKRGKARPAARFGGRTVAPPPLAMRALPALLALALAACQPDPAPQGPPADAGPDVPTFTGELAPLDDGTTVDGFAAFRDTLRDVVARRDTAALLAVVAPGARLSFGDTPGGPDGFRQSWFEGDAPEPVWDVLATLLEGGSAEEDGAVVVPFVGAFWPEDLDPFETVAVPDRDVSAYDAPGGTEVARLSEIALPVTGPARGGWRTVTLPDGQTAAVEEAEVLSPVGYRATFWDDGDGWQMRSLVTGD